MTVCRGCRIYDAVEWDLFLSFHGEDRPRARRLYGALTSAGVHVFFDEEAIPPGHVWLSAIEAGVLKAGAYVVLLSDKAPSRWVRAEADLALVRQQTDPRFLIVPLLADGFELNAEHGFLSGFQGIPLPDDESRWPSVVLPVCEHIRTNRMSFPPPEVTQRKPICPYPGLTAFDESNAHFFFGRSNEVIACVEKLRDLGGKRWLHIDGPSGSGKSSLARAGLVPAFRHGLVKGGPPQWRAVIMRPGRDPLENLACALCVALFSEASNVTTELILSRLTDHPRALAFIARETLRPNEGLLLVVDQLEEVFTLAPPKTDQERNAAGLTRTELFDAALAEVLKSEAPVYLVSTIRSDFSGRVSELHRLGEDFNAQAARFFLQPMTDALRQAVEAPARLVGLTFDPGLVDRMLADVRRLESGLPLVAHTLFALWNRRVQQPGGGRLTAAAYEQLGGVTGALAKDGDRILNAMDADDVWRAQSMLLQLVRIGRSTYDTKQPCLRADLLAAAGGEGDKAERVLAQLSGGRPASSPDARIVSLRLVYVSEDRVELVHEALLSAWGTLRGWIDAYRTELERRDDVKAVAGAWQKAGAPEEGLPSGPVLAHLRGADLALDRQRRLESLLPPISKAFIDMATRLEVQRHEAGLARTQRERRRLIGAVVLFVGLSIGASAAAFYSVQQRAEAVTAQQQAREALNAIVDRERVIRRQLANSYLARAADAFTKRDFDQAALHQLQAAQLHPEDRWVSRTVDWLTRTHINSIEYTFQSSHPAKGAQLSADLKWLVSWSRNGMVHLADLDTGRHKRIFTCPDYVNKATFSEDERQVLIYCADSTVAAVMGKSVRLRRTECDVDDDAIRMRTPDTLNAPYIHARLRECQWTGHIVQISPDFKTIVVWRKGGRTARAFEVETGRRRLRTLKHGQTIRSVVFSKDSRKIAIYGERALRLFSGVTGSQLLYRRGINWTDARFVRSDALLLAQDASNNLFFFDATSGRLHGSIDCPGTSYKAPVVFETAGTILCRWHNGAALLDLKTGKARQQVEGSRILTTIVSNDEKYLLIGSSDGQARVIDVANGSIRIVRHDSWVTGGAFSSDTRHLVTTSADGTARLVSVETGLVEYPPWRHDAEIWGAKFSPDDSSVLTWSSDGTARVFDVATGQQRGAPLRHDSGVTGASFSLDGTRVLTWGEDGRTQLFNVAGEVVRNDSAATQSAGAVSQGIARRLLGPVIGSRISKKTEKVLAWGERGAVLIDPTTGQETSPILRHQGIRSALFSASEDTVLTWGDGRVLLFATSNGAQKAQPIMHPDVRGAAMAVDVVATWDSKSVCLYRTPNHWSAFDVLYAPRLNLEYCVLAQNYLTGMAISPDGSRLLIWGASNSPHAVSVNAERPIELTEWTTRLIDVSTGNLIREIPLALDDASFLSDGKSILGWHSNKILTLDSTTARISTLPLVFAGGIETVEISRDETTVLVCSSGSGDIGKPSNEKIHYLIDVLSGEMRLPPIARSRCSQLSLDEEALVDGDLRWATFRRREVDELQLLFEVASGYSSSPGDLGLRLSSGEWLKRRRSLNRILANQ